MNWLLRWKRRLQALIHRDHVEASMDEEMRIHVELEAEHLVRTEGFTPQEARRAALVAFGGVERMKEHARSVRGTRWLEDMVQDVRIGARSMLKVPAFTSVAILTLALGIGATTAMFSIVNGVLLRPLPYPESDRLVAVWGRFLPESGFDFPQFPLSPPEYFDHREHAAALEDIAAYNGFRASLTSADGRPLSVRAVSSTANLFGVLRVPPALGRAYTTDEDVSGGPAVVVIGHDLWRRAYGGDPRVIGRTIRVNGRSAEVTGVMPAGFAYPTMETELWQPLGLDPALHTGRSSHYLEAVGRLADGATMQQAHAELAALMTRWEAAYPDVHTGHFLYVRPLVDNIVGNARPALLTLLGAVGIVLLIVCANVANLLLARGEVRRRELAVRSALGAARLRLVRQFLAEGAVLSLAGGLAGLALAYLLVHGTLALGAESIPRAQNIAVDARVLVFIAGIAVFTTIAFALAPVTRLSVAEPRNALGGGDRTATSSPGARVRQTLVTAQIALAVVVAIGAGLVVRSFTELTTVHPGFSSDSVLLTELSVPAGDYLDAADVVGFYEDLLERTRRLPGAVAAGATSTLPLGGWASNIDFRIDGVPPPGPGEPAQSGDLIITDPGFIEAFDVELIEGRYFEAHDRAASIPVVVVNRRLARMFWPGGRAVGGRLRVASDEDAPWLHVIGVIDDVQYRTLADEVRPAWYVPLAQMSFTLGQPARTFNVAVRTTGDPLVLAPSIRDVVGAVDGTLPVIQLRRLEQVVAQSVARPRFTTIVLGLFAALALVLGAVGIYGVLAVAVASRTREFGIRTALGADWRELTSLVLGEALRITLLGLGLGLLGALIAARLIEGLLFRVSPTDPATLATVSATVCLVALVASLVPLRRALRADPLDALRVQ